MHPSDEYDVVVIGGAFTGASAALLLKRKLPGTRILIVERSVEPDRKVGESTSEVAGCFLMRELRLYQYLSQNHLNKQGLRLWFTTPENECFGKCGEIGPYYYSRMTTFQLDRAQLDPHILSVAVQEGCELVKPARVTKLELNGLGQNLIEFKEGETTRMVKAKWVLDASGKAAVIPRMRKTLTSLDAHPTNAVWARFRGVKDLDGYELASKYPEYAKAVPGSRQVATNHLCGYGWWCWIIPLKDGDVSVGITYDSRLFTLPEGPNLTERLHAHLLKHPVGKYLFGEAVAVEKDTRTYSGLPYYSKEIAGSGWLVCGDAAGFMDPLYSQGLDYCAHAVKISVDILSRSLSGQDVTADLANFNQEFLTSYFRWWNALYRDKYYYLGDLELMWAAFLLDVGAYFIGPVRLVYDHGDDEWLLMPYHGPAGKFFSGFMALYNRRLAAIARKRLAAGVYGQKNLGMRKFVKQGFSPDFKVFKLLRMGVWQWLKCEWNALWLRPQSETAPAQPDPVPQPAVVNQ